LIAALIALLLVVGYFVWRGSAVDEGDPQTDAAAFDTPIVPQPKASTPPRGANQPAAAPAALAGPVVLTATDELWLRVSDAGGPVLMERTMRAGESYQVPPTAQRPMLRAGRPDALRVTVGQTVIPQLGPSGRPIGNVSLLPNDLASRLQAPAPASPTAAAAPGPAPKR
jgi:hypothetical protein